MTRVSGHAFPAAARSFVRALWGVDVIVSPLPESNELTRRRPRFIGSRLWLPESPLLGVPGSSCHYPLAAAAHVAAHLVFGGSRFLVGSLKPTQVAIISVLEDARVELLAAQRYPGLARLWAPFHEARSGGAKTSGALLARLARALHDQAYDDDDGWVAEARRAFFADRRAWHDPSFVRALGGRLGNDLGQMRVQFNARDYVVQPAYRDDNVGLWQFEQTSAPDGSALELEGARAPAQHSHDNPARVQDSPRSGDGRPSQAHEPLLALRVTEAAVPETPIRYPEWDYVICRERPAFASLWQKSAPEGDVIGLDAALAERVPAQRRLQRAARRLVNQRPVRLSRLMDGDRLDLPATIAAVVARASGMRPDPRVYRRLRFQLEPPAVLLLIDCSESLNALSAGASSSALEHARSASSLLAATLSGATRDWAIHGFCSNGRHDVRYSHFKDFDEPCDERVRARLAGMRAGFSTRLGTALRHAGRALSARRARRKLLLVVTDGEPSDVDVHDPKYLLFDAKRATQENHHLGIASFCLGLDAAAERSLRSIFGGGNYLLAGRPELLPEVLGRLYLRLAG